MRTTGNAEGSAPGVSAVIPVRDGERYLGEAIESTLGQSRPPLEVIVVNDGSTDSSGEIARSYGPPVRCITQPALGVSAALNAGTRLAGGELLAFLDADDLWTPYKLARQVAALDESPPVDAVLGGFVNFDGTGARSEAAAGYSKGAMLIRREAFERVGEFAEWRLGEFVEWYARAVDAGLAFRTIPEVVLLRRVHDSNTGVRLRDEREEYARMLKSVLDRRRAGRP